MSNKITRYGHKSDSQIIDSLRAENAALRKEVEQLKSELASEKQDYLDCEHMLHSERDTWQNKISELTRQRDLAVSALQFFMDHGVCAATYYNVRDALAAIKESEV